MKVFLDTNVWMSATIFAGLCEALLLQCAEYHRLLSSALVQREAHEVLRRKFPQVPNACVLFDAAWQAAELIADHAEPADDNDRRLVNAAAAVGADLFVTGDKRVLAWHAVETGQGVLRIVSPRDAWSILAAAQPEH
ncbi:MAG: PIN domain-containing protein [Rhodoferax sp.]